MSYFPIPKRFYQGQLSASDAALYTAPAAPTSGPPPKSIVKEVIVCNTDTVARTVTLRVRSGAVSGTTQEILHVYSLAAATTVVLVLRTVMEAGHIISGLASSADVVTLTISGVELLTVPTA